MFVPAFLFAATPAPLPAAQPALSASIDAAVRQVIHTERPVGAAIGVAKDGKLLYVKAFGLRNLTTKEAVDADTRFEIGSVTKQFTAAAILQLQEAGKLHIDDRLATFFPTFPHASEITLRELLNQISGLPDYLPQKNVVSAFRHAETLNDVAAKVRKLNFEPGTQWQYSNTNYWLLGKIVAMASGESYKAYVRTHLFRPAGMTRSGFVQDEGSYHDLALAYWRGSNGKGPLSLAPEIPESWAGGAGAIVSSVSDLVKWDSALTSGKIVTPADYTLMSSPGVLKDGHTTDYGMGLGINPLLGHKRIWHNGGTLGSFTMNGTYPDDHIDIVAFANSVDGNPAAMETAALGAIFPKSLAAAKQPAPGEDLAFRPRILHYLDETIHGTMPPSEMSAQFSKLATPSTQKHIAAMFSRLGRPTTVIFRGKQSRGDDILYRYRVQFATHAVAFNVLYDTKTKLVDGIGLGPAP